MATFVLDNTALRKLREQFNPRPILNGYAQHRRTTVREHLARGIDPYGNAYAPLKPGYAKQKRKKYGQKPILEASGKMIRSYKPKVSGSTFTESMASPAPLHYKGDPEKNLPQRLPLPDERGLPLADQDALWALVVKQAGGGQ